uniref:ZP domain-containing protein n=1 Tax=Salarias fasciatus TaxID=181472 RepID=A0A672F643_SALFA
MKPFIECNEDDMTFTASGGGFTELLVDREGASPISVFQLPSYCGYSLKSSWNDLEMMVPYDACYIIQENGSYTLPLLWWGSPLKLSCPMPLSTLTPPLPLSLPVVFCSPFGMAVQIFGQESDLPGLRVLVNEAWGPFVSEQCAYRVNIQAPVLTFFIPYSAPCFTQGDDLQLHLLLVEQEVVLSCPISPLFTNTPTTPWFPSLFPVLPQVPNIPDPVNLAPSFTPPPPSPPQPPTEEQIAHHPRFPHFELKYPEQPAAFSPRSQRPPPHQPVADGAPDPQEPQLLYPAEPAEFPYSLEEHKLYPSYFESPALVQATSAPDLGPKQDNLPQFPELPVDQSHLPFGLPYKPFFYPTGTPAPGSETQKPTNTDPSLTELSKLPPSLFYPTYYVQPPFYPTPTAPHAPLPPIFPSPPPPAPKAEVDRLFGSSFYATASYYPYWSGSYHEPLKSPPVTSPDADEPSYPFGQIPLPKSPHAQAPTSPPHAKEDPKKPPASQVTCPPYTQTICVHFSYLGHTYSGYPPHYLQYPNIYQSAPIVMPTVSSINQFTARFTTPAWPTPYFHNIQCVAGRMAAFLPFAHPDSIQVRDHRKMWVPLSTVSPLCGYMLQLAEGFGVILHSPLPACHSEVQTPTTISLPIRLWDSSALQYRTVDLKCLYQSTPGPGPVTPPDFIKPHQSPTISRPVVPKTQIQCSPHEMVVELPSGSVSQIVVKDIKGNQMKLQEAPKHCGYFASQTSDGKVRLSLQLHSRCHMSVQASTDTAT